MAEAVRLKCNKCGTQAAGDLAVVARLGGTHYACKEHAVGIPGNKGNRIARTCGKWIEDTNG